MRLNTLALGVFVGLASTTALAGTEFCAGLPDHDTFRKALKQAVANANGGLGLQMWASLVANDGTLCAVAFSGDNFTEEWLASRVISAQKANTANGLSVSRTSNSGSTNGLLPTGKWAWSTANLYTAVQPGGSLYGLQFSNPVETSTTVGTAASASTFGTVNDPMVGHRNGGLNVFGGGLALFNQQGVKVGGVGVSGDTSCTDHYGAWRLRHRLGLDWLGPKAGGISGGGALAGDPDHPDNIVFDIVPNTDGTGGTGQAPNGQGGIGHSLSGFGHPVCPNNPPNPKSLPKVRGF